MHWRDIKVLCEIPGGKQLPIGDEGKLHKGIEFGLYLKEGIMGTSG